MQKFFSGLPRYQFGIVSIYLLLILVIIFTNPDLLDYPVSRDDFGLIFNVLLLTILGFYIASPVLGLNIKKPNMSWKSLSLFIVYAVVAISIPEEIIFRGIIQGIFFDGVDIYFAVILSSLIFGIAHLPNGAKGINPKRWNWRFALLAFLAGIPLSYIFALTGNLFGPTILHALFLIMFKLFILENRRVVIK